MLIGPRMTAAIRQQSQLSREIGALNTQIATGIRLQRPSDDPAASARVSVIARRQADTTTWLANIEAANTLATRSEGRLGEAVGIMDAAAEVITRARAGITTASDRAIAATELRNIAADLRAIMTSKDSRGQSLFPADPALAVPVGDGLTLTATGTRADAFGPAGATLADLAEAAATAIESGTDAAVAAGLDALQAAQDRLVDARGAQGVRMTRLDAARERLIAGTTALIDERKTLEGTDITEATPLMQAKLLTLEAAQAAFARINRRTLFDLLG